MRTLQQQWESYFEAVIPANASDIQKSETRLAFYAGAQAMNSVFLSISEPDVSDEAGVQIIEGFQQELKEHFDSLCDPR